MDARELWQRPVSYAAVGATRAPDLMSHPPAGYRPFERRVLIGHGDARWRYAWTSALTWGIQRNAGFTITLSEKPSASAGGTSSESAGPGVFIATGDTALLGAPIGPFRVRAPARVVYVIDEPNRKGFAYGTMAGHPEEGEESFVVDQTEDGSVWLQIRAFSKPSNVLFRLGYPVLRLSQAFYTRRYFETLSGPIA